MTPMIHKIISRQELFDMRESGAIDFDEDHLGGGHPFPVLSQKLADGDEVAISICMGNPLDMSIGACQVITSTISACQLLATDDTEDAHCPWQPARNGKPAVMCPYLVGDKAQWGYYNPGEDQKHEEEK